MVCSLLRPSVLLFAAGLWLTCVERQWDAGEKNHGKDCHQPLELESLRIHGLTCWRRMKKEGQVDLEMWAQEDRIAMVVSLLSC